jgi:alpha-ketoglutarate-dependent taurine dioxygenase
MRDQATEGVWAARRNNIKPKAIRVSQEGLVKTSFIDPVRRFPLVVEPSVEGVQLSVWARNNLEFIETHLVRHGALLFRGFCNNTRNEFEDFLTAIALERMHYIEGATPRTELSDKVYTSTEYPPEHSIALHNELNYVITWPMKIFFFCINAAAQGGATPIADVRRVFNRIDPEIREAFARKGWMLVRNFSDRLSLPWERAFRVTEKAQLMDYCSRANVECEWRTENRLRTRQVRPAARRHPKTAEMVWFNHVAFWHISSLEPNVREMFLSEFSAEELPYNTYYGDGTVIEDSVVENLRRAYDQETVGFPWREGDILMADNMLVAHGRSPYKGTRRILAAMGEPSSRYAF